VKGRGGPGTPARFWHWCPEKIAPTPCWHMGKEGTFFSDEIQRSLLIYLFILLLYQHTANPPGNYIRNAHRWCTVLGKPGSARLDGTLFCFFCFFCCYKTRKPYFASRLGFEIKPLEVYPLGPRHSSSSCGPTKGTPPARTTLHAK